MRMNMTKTVLIADDSIFMRTWLKDLVEKSRYTVITEAKDGYEAINKYKDFSPDIVLLDMTMPKVNGLSALKAIKAYDPEAKVIMCTAAMGQKSLIMEALHLGAQDFIIKPYFDDLIPALKNID